MITPDLEAWMLADTAPFEGQTGPAADLACHVKALLCEIERLRAALSIIAQVRHVSGSAQGAFRNNRRVGGAALAGADFTDLDTVVAVAEGTWTAPDLAAEAKERR